MTKIFGDKVVIHNSTEKPKNGPKVQGYDTLGWYIYGKRLKAGYGTITDATAYFDFTQSLPFDGHIAYTF